MSKYSVLPLSLKGREAYTEASKEELRVLLALIELSGRDINPDELAQIANVSRARASAAIVYWQEAGFLADGTASNLSYEFEKSTRKTGISDDGALSTAKTIRDEKLAPLITECESIMGRSMNSSETQDFIPYIEEISCNALFLVLYIQKEKPYGKDHQFYHRSYPAAAGFICIPQG